MGFFADILGTLASTFRVGSATLDTSGLTAKRTHSLPDATTPLAGLNLPQTFGAAQRGTVTTITDAATITIDLSLSNDFTVTLGGSRTMGNPTNAVAGQSGIIAIVQDATGSRALAWAANWDWESGTAPTLSTAAGAVDVIAYWVRTPTSIIATLAIKGAA